MVGYDGFDASLSYKEIRAIRCLFFVGLHQRKCQPCVSVLGALSRFSIIRHENVEVTYQHLQSTRDSIFQLMHILSAMSFLTVQDTHSHRCAHQDTYNPTLRWCTNAWNAHYVWNAFSVMWSEGQEDGAWMTGFYFSLTSYARYHLRLCI